MNTRIAPDRTNAIQLGRALQLRLDLRWLGRPEGNARLRGYLDRECAGTAVYDQSLNLAEYHAHVEDEEKGLDFVIVVFSKIPPHAYLALDVDSGIVSRQRVFQGKTLDELEGYAS